MGPNYYDKPSWSLIIVTSCHAWIDINFVGTSSTVGLSSPVFLVTTPSVVSSSASIDPVTSNGIDVVDLPQCHGHASEACQKKIFGIC